MSARRRLAARSDASLAAMAARGNLAAFEELTRRAAGPVRAVLRRMGAPAATADDVTQDAMTAAFHNVGTYRADGPFAAWTCRIAARLYLKQLKREARTVLMAEPVDAQIPALPDGVSAAARLDLDRALETLSPAERLCVTLCHGAGYTHAEIAAQTGLPLGTVKSHVTRGVQKLQRLLRD